MTFVLVVAAVAAIAWLMVRRLPPGAAASILLFVPLLCSGQVKSVTFSPQILHSTALAYREFKTEFFGCLFGTVSLKGDTVEAYYYLPGDIKPSQSEPYQLLGKMACGNHTLVVAEVHSHPAGCLAPLGIVRRCVDAETANPMCHENATDMHMFSTLPYPISVVVCGYGKILVVTRNGLSSLCEYDPEADKPECKDADEADDGDLGFRSQGRREYHSNAADTSRGGW